MDKRKYISDDPELLEFFEKFQRLNKRLGAAFLEELKRLPALADLYSDRWERAQLLGFGENTNIYDNCLVLGNVQVGKECWIGPNTILDGSGDLLIGDYCTVSAGVQIYTHDNVQQTLSSKKEPIQRSPVSIGNNVYIGPNTVITKGITIGNNVIIGAFSLVNKSIADNCTVFGQPARTKGKG